jgi:LysM repeat protein
MKKFVFFSLIIFIYSTKVFSQNLTPEQYIEKYKDVAITEMNLFGIPASITMAQACLESNFGNSMLARKANNHFGIKCHSNWNGKKVYKDDDKKHECFRHYKSAWESFRDHSKFLKNGKRYAFLFNYKITDYKKWARGLKKAGYATSPSYPKRLIGIIEKYKLYELDKYYEPGKNVLAENNSTIKNSDKKDKRKERKEKRKRKKEEKRKYAKNYNFSFNPFGRDIKENNRVKYVIVKQGDTPFKIAKEMQMMEWEIYKYNDLKRGSKLQPGQILYIQPKRCKAERGIEKYTVKQGETLHDISQKFAVKERCIRRKNNMKPDEEVKPGDVLWLRKRKPSK